MAAASPSNNPECSICCEQFRTPKFLPCGHTFCLHCIERYIGDRIETVRCPLCGQDVTIPEGGAKMFTTNFIAQTTTPPDTTHELSSTTLPNKTQVTPDTPVIGETTSPDTTHESRSTSPDATQVIAETTSLDTTQIIAETTSLDTTQIIAETTSPIIGETTSVDTTQVLGETTSPDTTHESSSKSPDATQVLGETTPLDPTQVLGEITSLDTMQIIGKSTSPDTTPVIAETTPLETTQPPSVTTLDTTEAAKQSSSTVKLYCSNHNMRELEFYCIICNTFVCSRCFITQHNGHAFIDIESETAQEKATELVLNSEKFIKDKIENLEKTHAALLKASENLKCFAEDTCSRISKQTEKIITDIREKSEEVQTEIRQNVDQKEIELTETREKVMKKIKNFKLDLETNLPCLTEDSCAQIIVSLTKIKELEQLCETMKDDTSKVYHYKDWREKNFSVDIGSVVTKSYYLHKLNQFRINMNDIEEEETLYYSKDKFTSNEVVWSCVVRKYSDGYLGIGVKILSSDNPKLDYCIIDGEVSLLNIDDDSRTLTNIYDYKKLSNNILGRRNVISWATFIDKNEGYTSSDGQFVVQFDITNLREINFKEPSSIDHDYE